MRTLSAEQCRDHGLTCFCYTAQSLALIAQEIAECEIIRYEAKEYIALSDVKTDKVWYESPNILVGSVIVSFSAGALLGYFLAKR